ncbi:hypothetical protein EFV37_17705 [Mesorhizobium loti]|uniref:Uncharacterized protein n=1 Tax=Mesorhizobium jarvisii TaxID=1777867 RepID=A0A6M7TJ83_9HYPH|nr:hypothetical protein EB229_17700 [Mesorhizobium jarvisii]QKD09834.1 hypothetical protein EFV37_17705 [Mesorhizobium loti]RJT28679.1 hypothetical protein D3242_31320 [Mesorhizobium jarvisii]
MCSAAPRNGTLETSQPSTPSPPGPPAPAPASPRRARRAPAARVQMSGLSRMRDSVLRPSALMAGLVRR